MGNILSVLKARSLGCVLNVLRSGEQWLAASLAIRSALQSRRALWWWTYLGAPLDLRHLILICLTGAPEKEMATHSRIIAWRISWTEEPGRLQSMGSQRIRHDRETNTYLHLVYSLCPWLCFCYWDVSTLKGYRQCQPTPVLLPGKSHGRRSLVGCSPWGR